MLNFGQRGLRIGHTVELAFLHGLKKLKYGELAVSFAVQFDPLGGHVDKRADGVHGSFYECSVAPGDEVAEAHVVCPDVAGQR